MRGNNESILNDIINLKEVKWLNNNKKDFDYLINNVDIGLNEILDAEKRLIRFKPLIKKIFNETIDGLIESPLFFADELKNSLEKYYNNKINGRLLLKCDSELKIAGSIKARGGIYEVLKIAEKIAIENNYLNKCSDYSIMENERFRNLFSKYKISVGSTGNLGLSIGIMSASLGFNVDVHMSKDAKEWKKEKLRNYGVNVIEHDEDYSKAVEFGRNECLNDEYCYFIDDENSKDLFLGYSVAAIRLKKQLEDLNINITRNNKLNVYLPCGVGGAPGGISFGLKHVFKDNVNCYFVEPVNAPCMLLGLLTRKFDNVKVSDYNIDLITEADGLAVGSPSKLVSEIADILIDGIYTINDDKLFELLYLAKKTENKKIEPSAASGILGPILFNKDGIHISWLTGGLFLPDEVYNKMYIKGEEIIKRQG